MERVTSPLPRSGVPAPSQNGSFTAKELPHPARTCKNSTPCFIYIYLFTRRTRATPILLNNRNLWRLHMEIGWEHFAVKCEQARPLKSYLSVGLLPFIRRFARSFPFESLLQATNSHVEHTGLDHALIIGTDEGQVVGGQFERNLAALARLEGHFCESL